MVGKGIERASSLLVPWEPIRVNDNFLFSIAVVIETVHPVTHFSLTRIRCIKLF